MKELQIGKDRQVRGQIAACIIVKHREHVVVFVSKHTDVQ